MIEKSSCSNDELKKEETKIFKQRLQRVHIIIGIWFSSLMYIALFFGIFAVFLPYISNWERESRHIKIVKIEDIDFSSTIDKVLADKEYPKYNPIFIRLPNQSPNLSISTKFMETITFNPNTNQELEKVKEPSNLAGFLNGMHYGEPLSKIYMKEILGFTAVAGIFLIIGGLIQVSIIKYQNGGKSVSSRFSNWHRKIFIWLFLPFLLIVWNGAELNVPSRTFSSSMTYIATKGENTSYYKIWMEVVQQKDEKVEKSGIEASMLSLSELTKKVKEVNSNIEFSLIQITNYGDETARVKFTGYDPTKPFLNGIMNKPTITLSGVDGSLIKEHKALDMPWSGLIYEAFSYLHLLFSQGVFVRMFVFITMLLCTFAVGFGVLLYLEKQARKFPSGVAIYQGFGKLSLAVMIGVIPATGLLFVLQWLLPFDMENRVLIQKGLFACFWIGTLTYSFYKLNSYQTAKEFLYLGGILFVLSPIIHFIFSGFSPIRLWNEEIYTILSVDIGLFVFGLILLIVAYKLPTNREKIQEFWTSRGVK